MHILFSFLKMSYKTGNILYNIISLLYFNNIPQVMLIIYFIYLFCRSINNCITITWCCYKSDDVSNIKCRVNKRANINSTEFIRYLTNDKDNVICITLIRRLKKIKNYNLSFFIIEQLPTFFAIFFQVSSPTVSQSPSAHISSKVILKFWITWI